MFDSFPNLLNIRFLGPAMFAGLGLLLFPIIAHLLNRQSRKTIVFPTIRLLRASVASQSKWFRLRLLLLALRCLLLAIFVGAFARPVWTAFAGTPQQTGTVVIVLDASASTSQQSGSSVFSQLQAAATRTVRELQPGVHKVNVIVAGARPRLLFPQPVPNFNEVILQLEQLAPQAERADLQQAILLASEQLRTAQRGGRRLVLLSDLQDSNWNELATAQLSSALPARTAVTLIEPSQRAAVNVGLSEPRVFPSQPLRSQPTQLIVKATNYSDRSRQVEVTARLGDEILSRESAQLEPFKDQDLTFPVRLPSAGDYRVEFSLSETDGLSADDKAFLVVSCVERWPIAIVSSEPATATTSAAYFVSRALAPYGDERDVFDITHIPAAEVTPEMLRGQAAVFLTSLTDFSDPARKAFTEYVRGGGGVICFTADAVTAQQLALWDQSAKGDGLLPFPMAAPRQADNPDKPQTIANGAWRSPMLKEFDQNSQFAWSQVKILRWNAAGPLRGSGELLLTFADGTPALAWRPVTLGRVVALNMSPALDSSDLIKHGLFVAFMQILAREARPAIALQRGSLVGSPLPFLGTEKKLATGSLLEVTLPDGQIVPIVAPAPASPAVLPRADRPGLYELRQNQKSIGLAAVNLDARESDLRHLSRATVETWIMPRGGDVQTSRADTWGGTGLEVSKPLWWMFLIAVMACMALESLCLIFWQRRQA